MCDRWLNDVAAFVEDMGPKPSPKHSVDRIDNDGNYEPANCRWATAAEQKANQSRSVYVLFRGEFTPVSVVADLLGISCQTLKARIARGWPEDLWGVPPKTLSRYDIERVSVSPGGPLHRLDALSLCEEMQTVPI